MSFVIVILVGAAAWQHRTQLIRIAYFTLGITIFAVMMTWLIRLVLSRRNKPLNIDAMTGLEFENYVAALLKQNGFRRVRLTKRFDYGVDIIAEKKGICWGIQVKRHAGLVNANAVRQVVTALKMYSCDRSMVITNSTFSTIAQRLAKAINCVLIDRNGLQRLIDQRCIL
jgi:HJR/Mrr/RecB family endonuclease